MTEESTYIKKWQVPTADITLRADGIIDYRLLPGCQQTIQDYQEVVLSLVRNVGSTRQLPMMVSIGEGASVEHRAVSYARKVEYLIPVNALGIVVENPLHYALARAYYVVNKPSLPYQVFRSHAAAIAWLRTHVSPEYLAEVAALG